MSWLTRSGIKKAPPDTDENSQLPHQPDPKIRNDRASPVIEDERGVPSVNERSYRSKAVPLSVAAMALAIVAIIWVIPSPQTPVAATKGDPRASKNERFDENRLNAVLYPATPLSLPEPPKPIVFEPPPPPPPLKIIPAPIAGVAPPPPSGPKQITPLERRQQSKVLIIGASKTGGARKGSFTESLELPERGFVLTAASAADGDGGYLGAGSANDAAGGFGPARGSRAKPSALVSADGPVVLTAAPGLVGDRGFEDADGAPASAPGLGAGIGSSPDMGGVTGQAAGVRGNAPNPDPLGDSLRPTLIAGTAASRLASRTFMLTQGTLLDCNLDVAISSAVPGMTKCTLARNVYGDDRRVVLLERGTEFTGQYRGALQQGQNRLFILWARAKTPKGVVINLASPGTDSLGRSGVTGFIDTHFWERFGAALFLSVVSDSISILAAQAQQGGRSGNGNGNGNTTVVLPQSTTQAGKNAAAIAVENSIRIPPTLDKNQGGHVSIFIARDLDFRTVYALKAVDAR